jgi:anti-anti-sigma factor
MTAQSARLDEGQRRNCAIQAAKGLQVGASISGKLHASQQGEVELAMRIEIREQRDGVVVSLHGRITLEDGVESLRSLIRKLVAERRRTIVLDLQGVRQIDSSGLAELVASSAAAAARGTGLRLFRTPRRTQDLLRITRLDRVFGGYSGPAQV